jgi:RNA-binding protein
MELGGKERRHLRALAHHLTPVVVIGKEGVSESVRAAVDRALADHELIKIRVLEACPDDRKEVARAVAEATGAGVAGVIGRVVILYRPHPEEPRITLPRRE